MKQPYLRQYSFEIKTLTPVFIGSGRTVGKKEYIFNRRQSTVTFLDMWKLFKGLDERGLLPAYEDYILRDYSDLYFFLKDHGITSRDYEDWADRIEEVADRELNDRNTKEIQTFVKDPYGLPYIPGSSLKGALRNIFQSVYYLDHPQSAARIADEMRHARVTGRKNYMSDINRHMSEEVFHQLDYNQKRKSDPVNDMMKGFAVSDSLPLKKEDLALYQKVDLSLQGEERSLPLLRECIRPGTPVSFMITVDSRICPYKAKDIVDAVTGFYKNYKAEFMSKFRDAPGPGGNISTFFLGGGAGYVSKTSTYAVLHGDQAIRQAGVILNNTLPEKVRQRHGHLRDAERGASPHLIKGTINENGQFVQMGACHVLAVRKINKEEMNS